MARRNDRLFIRMILLAAVAVLCLTATGCRIEKPEEKRNPVAGSYRQISQEEAQEIMKREDGYLILDVRRQDEFDAGHIPGAVLIPNETIEDTPPPQLPDKDQLILIYCRSGNRSKQAAQKLADMGYTGIYEFGGINTWPGEIVTED